MCLIMYLYAEQWIHCQYLIFQSCKVVSIKIRMYSNYLVTRFKDDVAEMFEHWERDKGENITA